MIALNMKQGSAEWHFARLGIPTASQFSKIIQPKKLKPSASAEGYMHDLLAEWIIGMPTSTFSSSLMQRGTELEDEAVAYYEMQQGVTVERVGFAYKDARKLVGASPDGLVGAHGGLEIKVPSAQVHVANLLSMTDDHYAQAQGGMYVTGRKWWDLLSYSPVMPSAITRYERDEAFMDALDGVMVGFLADLLDARKKLLDRGCEPATSLDPAFAASLNTKAA